MIRGTLSEIAEDPAASASLSVLALLPDTSARPVLPLGLPDETYEHHRNMITHPEIRAVVLSKLKLTPGVLWDLGAGSGSVGIEAAGLCPELQVFSIEKDPGRVEQIEANVAREGLSNIRVLSGRAEELIGDLPVPDRIFVGGGGRDLLERAFERLAPGGILVMTGVMLETIALMSRSLPDFRREFLTLQVSRSEEILPGGSMLRAENPITIGVWKKESAR